MVNAIRRSRQAQRAGAEALHRTAGEPAAVRETPAQADKQTVDPEKSTRGARSRQATRQKLVAAALKVFSRKGWDATAIGDITEEADVGRGSFYNHFKTKDEIAMQVFEWHANDLAAINDMIGAHEGDTATAVAYIQKVFLVKAVEDPIWGWFVIHATNGMPEMSRVFMERGKRAIARGVEQGRFSVSSVETAMRIILAALLATMRAFLEKPPATRTVNETIECLLRMLGVDAAEARMLSLKKLPTYVTRQFSKRPS